LETIPSNISNCAWVGLPGDFYHSGPLAGNAGLPGVIGLALRLERTGLPGWDFETPVPSMYSSSCKVGLLPVGPIPGAVPGRPGVQLIRVPRCTPVSIPTTDRRQSLPASFLPGSFFGAPICLRWSSAQVGQLRPQRPLPLENVTSSCAPLDVHCTLNGSEQYGQTHGSSFTGPIFEKHASGQSPRTPRRPV